MKKIDNFTIFLSLFVWIQLSIKRYFKTCNKNQLTHSLNDNFADNTNTFVKKINILNSH